MKGATVARVFREDFLEVAVCEGALTPVKEPLWRGPFSGCC